MAIFENVPGLDLFSPWNHTKVRDFAATNGVKCMQVVWVAKKEDDQWRCLNLYHSAANGLSQAASVSYRSARRL